MLTLETANKAMEEYNKKIEEQDRRAEEVINILKKEHLSLKESEELFDYIVDKIRDTPLG